MITVVLFSVLLVWLFMLAREINVEPERNWGEVVMTILEGL